MTLKEKILEKLSHSEDYISGQSLAEEFGVSRAAVSKAVKALRSDGYGVDSVNNKGHRLVFSADALNADAIRSQMNSDAQNLELFVLESVDSTNNEAKRMLADGFSDDALIVANEQTGGRGRLGRSFYSPKNTGIYMSFLYQSELKLSDAVTITTAAAVAVVRAIEAVTDIIPEIKWVNDVYANGKKVCGILTEAVSDFETGTAKSIIIGIGINITTENFPDDIKERAASLVSTQTKKTLRNELIAQTANELTAIYRTLPDKSSFIGCYKDHSMIIGKEIDFYVNNNKQSGTAVDINDDGSLIVAMQDGSKITLSSGEVTVRLHS